MTMPDIASVADVPRRQARSRPDAVALSYNGRETSFAEFDALASACANALIAEGIRPGDRISCLAKNNDDFYVLWFGAVKAGACLAPVNWRLAPPEIAFILKDAGSKMLVCGQGFEDVIDMIVSDCADLHRLIHFEPGHPRWPAFRDWIGQYPSNDPLRPVAGDDDVIQLYTSGTTGRPKGVRLTHDNYLSLFGSAAAPGGWALFEAGKAALQAMPQFHVAGCNMGALSMFQGTRCVILGEIVPSQLLDTLARERVAYAFLVPAVINMLLQAPGVAEADFSHLEQIYYGASPIAEEVLKRAIARFGCEFIQLYGLTETIGGGTMLSFADHDPARGKLRACGRPWGGFEVRVVTPEGQLGQAGAVGEIQIRSKGVMKGYWNRPEATAQAIDAEGWFSSGDAGFFDADGYLYIHDRVKDMIVSGGENIYPAEVENVLFSHPGVADAAVIGVPDERWGEAVKAMVVMKPGAEFDPAALIAHCREHIAAYKAPKTVDRIEALPRNPSGKVLRRELRAPFWIGRDRNVG
ncbi:MAG TPA: long-chain-fatty-acid--CoA ligase [Caulobacteraceae bacterium]|jgi:fatty-acyl-CoA synthase|nr:long-chain-fatty-acid--CoA ligase [Caulobacteraceae bacterium]